MSSYSHPKPSAVVLKSITYSHEPIYQWLVLMQSDTLSIYGGPKPVYGGLMLVYGGPKPVYDGLMLVYGGPKPVYDGLMLVYGGPKPV